MVYLLVLVLMLGAFAIVSWPLLSSSRRAFSLGREEDPEWERLVDQQAIANRAIRDLEFEHQLGNLGTEEFESQRARWQADAEAALQGLEHLKESAEVQVETEAAGASVPKRGVAAQAGNCDSCGKPVPGDDRFCPHCGEPVERTCPACGAVRPAGDLFCGKCGARMESKT